MSDIQDKFAPLNFWPDDYWPAPPATGGGLSGAITTSGGAAADLNGRIGIRGSVTTAGGAAADLTGQLRIAGAVETSGGIEADFLGRIGLRGAMDAAGPGPVADLTGTVGETVEPPPASGGGGPVRRFAVPYFPPPTLGRIFGAVTTEGGVEEAALTGRLGEKTAPVEPKPKRRVRVKRKAKPAPEVAELAPRTATVEIDPPRVPRLDLRRKAVLAILLTDEDA